MRAAPAVCGACSPGRTTKETAGVHLDLEAAQHHGASGDQALHAVVRQQRKCVAVPRPRISQCEHCPFVLSQQPNANAGDD